MASSKGKGPPQTVKKDKNVQDEFRKLMREKQSTPTKKIESPLAKYNNLGQLVCVLCNLKIKNELLWTAHVNGRNHKETLNRLKKKKDVVVGAHNSNINNSDTGNVHQSGNGRSTRSTTSSSSGSSIKRSISVESESPVEKKAKFDSNPTTTTTPQTQTQRKIRVSFSLSDDEEDEKTPSQDVLPPDFIDAEMKSTEHTSPPSSSLLPTKKQASNSALPEGFFDDPFLDAKVRKVEYKDPMDDEWDKFQKVISEASTASQAMVEENDEDMKTEREIDEIEEQIHNWARVEALQQKKDECLTSRKEMADDKMDEASTGDDNELDDFQDWRSKSAWR